MQVIASKQFIKINKLIFVQSLSKAYDALRSKHPYKLAITHKASCTMIQDGAGKHFDPVIVDAFPVVEAEFAEIA